MKISTSSDISRLDGRPRSQKQVALFCHLAKILWQLSCRIRWAKLGASDRLRLDAVQPMLDRAAAKARNATSPTADSSAA